jgi:hypothetical protein
MIKVVLLTKAATFNKVNCCMYGSSFVFKSSVSIQGANKQLDFMGVTVPLVKLYRGELRK